MTFKFLKQIEGGSKQYSSIHNKHLIDKAFKN